MSAFPIENRAGLPEPEFAAIKSVVAGQTSMKQAFDWLLGMSPPVAPVDCIAMDVYSHEILFPYPGSRWLVYSCS